jgi:septum formation protein
MKRKVILASQSPRRVTLLRDGVGLADFDVIPSDFDEYVDHSRDVTEVVQELALGKARAVAEKYPDAWVIGGDTLVSFEGAQIGKPTSPADALSTLQKLAGNVHQVSTGIALVCKELGIERVEVETVDVHFRPQTLEKLEEYVATGDPMDKAGSYGMQSKGGFLVDHVDGDETTVIGLPVELTRRMLREAGVL